jgi:hypothetical protein
MTATASEDSQNFKPPTNIVIEDHYGNRRRTSLILENQTSTDSKESTFSDRNLKSNYQGETKLKILSLRNMDVIKVPTAPQFANKELDGLTGGLISIQNTMTSAVVSRNDRSRKRGRNIVAKSTQASIKGSVVDS